MKALLLSCLFLLAGAALLAQQPERTERMTIGGTPVLAIITETDTIFVADLDNISFSSPRTFASKEEELLYKKYKRYAARVYPYAAQAIALFREVQEESAYMSKRERKRYLKRKHAELKEQFDEQLTKLSKTQGKILIKMIEKELNTPFYDLVQHLRGGFTAFYWHNLGKLYGYDLKEGYRPGQDPILDVVLADFSFPVE